MNYSSKEPICVGSLKFEPAWIGKKKMPNIISNYISYNNIAFEQTKLIYVLWVLSTSTVYLLLLLKMILTYYKIPNGVVLSIRNQDDRKFWIQIFTCQLSRGPPIQRLGSVSAWWKASMEDAHPDPGGKKGKIKPIPLSQVETEMYRQ